MVLVSVILPSYNQDQYISEAIDSILNQNVRDFELIIIDNKSTDRSIEIIKDYQEKDKRIKTIFHEKNEGISKSLNDGIDMARGKYIAINCTDDVWDAYKLEKQIKILKNDEDLIVWTEGIIIDGNGKYIGKTFTQEYDALKKKKSGNIFFELLTSNFICLSSLIFKKKNFERTRFNTQLNVLFDYKVEVDFARKYNFYYIKEPLIKYRIHSANMIKNRKNLLQDSLKINQYFLRQFGKKIPIKIKWKIISSIIMILLEHNLKKNARHYIYKALKLYPLDPINIRFLIKSYVNSNSFLTFAYILLKFYQFIIIKLFPSQCALGEEGMKSMIGFLNKM